MYKTAILVHVWYEDVFLNVIAPKLAIHKNVDLYINFVKRHNSNSFIQQVKEMFPAAVILFSDNPGRDIRGYLNCLSYIYHEDKQYDNYIFVHTKTNENDHGKRMLENLLRGIIQDEETLRQGTELVKERYGMVGAVNYVQNTFFTQEEKLKTINILKRLGCNKFDVKFVAGTMFNVSAAIIDHYLRKPGIIEDFNNDFYEDSLKHSGWHHAWERVFGTMVIDYGKDIYEYQS